MIHFPLMSTQKHNISSIAGKVILLLYPWLTHQHIMGRSAFYTSPASKVRSLKRAIQYFMMKAISNLRKIPDLDVQRCAVVDIPPTHNIRNLPPQELKKNCYPFQPVKPSSIPNNLCHVNQPILHQNLPPTQEPSRIRTT